jgi:hypothetical protein
MGMHMQLKAIIDDDLYTLEVPEELVRDSEPFFQSLDQTMAQGIQLGRYWIQNPSLEDRLRIIGDRLLGALEQEKHDVGRMMAAYILNRAPGLEYIRLDTTGELENTEIRFSGRAGGST